MAAGRSFSLAYWPRYLNVAKPGARWVVRRAFILSCNYYNRAQGKVVPPGHGEPGSNGRFFER